MRGRLLAAAVLLVGAGAAAAQESDSASGAAIYAELRLVSRYVWRGYDLSRGRSALQPWVELALPSGFGANFFTTAALDRRVELDEFQVGLTYRREVAPGWELGAGYLAYLQPGTETEPSSDDSLTALDFNRSGEFLVSMARSWEGGSATLTYSRGHGSGEGNSVNLWLEHEVGLGGRWSALPYLQADYLDEYGPPGRFGERISGVELGLPVTVRLGKLSVQVAGHLTRVPSGYVRASNGESGSSDRGLLAWGAVAVSYERD